MSTIGKPLPYIDAYKKVTGAADFTDDIPAKNGLHVRFLRSIVAHAEIIRIDITEAEKIPGVKFIATGDDMPVPYGVLAISQDENAIAYKKVRYIGEIVAAVAADTYEIAIQACKKIKVKYNALKEFLSIEDSLQDCTKEEQIHEHARHGNNIHKVAELRFGNQEEGLKNSDFVCENNFEFEGVNHAFTEPQATLAYLDNNDILTVISATQVPHYLHKALAKVLNLPLHRVRVIKPSLGGGFGGKSDPLPHEIITAYMALKTGQPCRTRLNREEVFLTNHGRHPTKINMRLGADKHGKFNVLDASIAINGGAFGSFGVVTSYYNGVLLQGPYKIDNFGFITRRVYSNKPPCGAMRGHGAVNPRFAIETLIDEMAVKLKTDPIELRLKNLLSSNTLTVGKYRITSNGLKTCLENVMKESDWKNKWGKLSSGKGIGVGCGFFISGSALPIIWNRYPQTVVHIKLDFDGRIVVFTGASDIGQGSDTVMAMIAAEVLGLEMNKIYVKSADTTLTPVDLGSYSSRVTFMVGNATKQAAEKLKSNILAAVAKEKNITVNEIYLENEHVVSYDKKINLNWEEVVEITMAGRGAIIETGNYISPKLGGDFKGAGAGLSPSYSFGACIAEVEVNSKTGEVELSHIWGAHDCGKALNPQIVEGQLEGSWHMGLGQAISEAMKFHKGLIINSNLLDYKIPTSMDTPDISTSIVESIDPEGPFGAKECGEGALHPVIPAIANAIYNAVGVRITNLPLNRDDLLKKYG